MIKFIAVYAYAHNMVFGKDDELPWKHCKSDMLNFKKFTDDKIVIMGAKTFMSLPSKLTNRINVVLTTRDGNVLSKNNDTPDYIIKIDSYGLNDITQNKELIDIINNYKKDVVFIGGTKILESVINIVDEAYVSVFGYNLGNVYLDEKMNIKSNYIKENFKSKFELYEEFILYSLKRK